MAAPPKGSSHSRAGERLAARKRVERELRTRRRRLRARLVTVAVVAAVGAALFGGVALYRSQLFPVRNVRVVGNEQLSTERVLELAAVPTGATLIRFPGSEVRERLESDPWIEHAQVTRDFPDTMQIRVSERVPVALVDLGADQLWLVDRHGFVIGEQTAETTRTLTVIRDLEGVDPVIGRETMSEPLLNALAILEGLSSELRERVRAISAPTVERTALITKDDVEIVVGPADDIALKDEIARRILAEQAGKVVYINVRSTDRPPVWRGLDDE